MALFRTDVINIEKGLDFANLKQTFSNDYITTYTDKSEKIIKIRDKFKLFNWGAAAVIEIDNNSVKINSFPMSNIDTKSSRKLTDKIINKLKEATMA